METTQHLQHSMQTVGMTCGVLLCPIVWSHTNASPLHNVPLIVSGYICPHMSSKIEKVPRGIRGEKSSKDMASSRNLVSTIGALASPKIGDGTRCPEG